ncbi:crotonobetainyl-CoA:carnitine CoA-transferase CaiB-like acyl-CoA transferase [Roseiarcus fermentans]|uniref:Crotonobetainyl-CoA:carnitine CoA-transferase CaiB-like acyl-CoA transferase n=1 Tax=Roseiarcus fermentans TaxID=1473586 RepID=A0A366F5H6_9HYPH|nr:CoA transferase [Roseiarcus fermentans]RBP09877.1 crotonobetainyl-CoA:carnitine CoA-transferase CaiB-like acyl-CoA transferase [Roseiarcus fermentans]
MTVLGDVRVLDLTRVVGGPLATQTLADLGAEVIKIEKPGDGDDTRRMGPFLKDQSGAETNDSAFFLAFNRSKKSVAVDITTERGQDLVRRLAAQSDVLVENYKAQSLKRYGLDYESLRRENPRLIYCSMTGFGQEGPYATRPAYDFVLQGMSGLMSTCGRPDGVPGAGPMRTSVPITDVFTGLYATISILGALMQRDQTGRGQFIDSVMLDASVSVSGHLALGYLMTGKTPARIGNANPVAAPSEVFATADGEIIVAAGNNGQFQALADAIDQPELKRDPRFDTNTHRVQNRAALFALLAKALSIHDTAHLVRRLSAAGVPCGPINTLAQVFADPQVRHRGIQKEARHKTNVNVPTLKSPLNLSDSPVDYRAAPMLGEHTEEVLRDLLGVSDIDLALMKSEKVI